MYSSQPPSCHCNRLPYVPGIYFPSKLYFQLRENIAVGSISRKIGWELGRTETHQIL